MVEFVLGDTCMAAQSVLRQKAQLLTSNSENKCCLLVSSWSAEEQITFFCQTHALLPI